MRKRKSRCNFVKRTINLPGALWPYVEAQAAQPLYSGNVSDYMRALIVREYDASTDAAAGADTRLTNN